LQKPKSRPISTRVSGSRDQSVTFKRVYANIVFKSFKKCIILVIG
jgi:hypothetical protein